MRDLPVEPGLFTTDALALAMFRQVLDPAKWEVEVLSAAMLSAELVALVGEKAPVKLDRLHSPRRPWTPR